MKWILCLHSKYFRKAFEFDGIEAKSNTISLEDVDETTFRHFLSYIYIKKLPFDLMKSAATDPGTLEEAARLFIFAEIYDLIEVRRHCVQVFVAAEQYEDWSILEERLRILPLVFDNVPETSSLYRLLADIEVYNVGFVQEEDIMLWVEAVPKSLIARKLFVHYNKQESTLYSCDYHEHQSDVDRQQCPLGNLEFSKI